MAWGRGSTLVCAGAAAAVLLAGCSHGGKDGALTASSPGTPSSVAGATASTAFTSLTSAPNISVPSPACKIAAESAQSPDFNVLISAPMPMAVADVTWRYGGTERRFTMKTDGKGTASHTLTVPASAAGSEVSMTASFVVTHATCTTTFAVPAALSSPVSHAGPAANTKTTTVAGPPPFCQVSISGSPTPGGSVTVMIASNLNDASADVNWQYGTTTHTFPARTDTGGGASHALIVPKQAAGYTVVVQANFPASGTACTTSFPVG